MISAVVLSHNDEGQIARCVDSLAWCDEVVVVDDYSTDTTTEIAKKMGVRIYKRHLDNDFSSQRNFGLSKAKGEWVLFVDSDEIVSKELAYEIKNATGSPIGLGMTSYLGYYVRRKDYLFGRWLKHGETSKVRLLRLAKKDAGQWIRPVHEVWNIQGNTGELFTPLEHFPHQNVAQFLDEINRYSTLNARYLFSQKVRVSWWHVVGYPVTKFFLNYFLYLGFLDGTSGTVIAIFMSFHSFLTRAKLWQLWDRAA